ncbi:PDZ domain-containing protein [Sorangium sp. So ce296]|uniref:PDZ domain-containing protein n=1 Tax=Sorangium sp. So ce296 TaxID=3133296 RepID=UPI003F6348D9
MLTPLVPLAVAACRGDCPRVEASQPADTAQPRVDASRADAAQPRAGVPASQAETARREKPSNPAPTATVVPAPWYLTIQPTAGDGVRIASMDIRSFTSPLLEPGDVILAVDGRPVHSIAGLESHLRACAPGDMVVLTVLRNETTIDYAMLQMPADDAPAPAPASAAEQGRPGG